MSELDPQLQKVKDDIDSCYKQLVADRPINQLPERVFKQTFLPYFIGEKNFREHADLLTAWVSIAGNPSNSVNVINDAGDILFTVPPLFSTEFIDPANKARIPYDGVINEYHSRTASSPKDGDRFLKTVLAASGKIVMTDNNNVSEYKEMWNKVFDHYNIRSEQEKKQDNSFDDEISFD